MSRFSPGSQDRLQNWPFHFAPPESLQSVAELGWSGGSKLSPLLLERAPGLRCHSFENGSTHDAASPLPLPDASQDLFLCVDLFERLRMDELYMVCHEARRILRPGGRWLLRSLSLGDRGLERWISLAAARIQGRRALELTHYISPEDWITLEDRKTRESAIMQQYLVLERLPG